jgi:hypothetical protein
MSVVWGKAEDIHSGMSISHFDLNGPSSERIALIPPPAGTALRQELWLVYDDSTITEGFVTLPLADPRSWPLHVRQPVDF